MLYKANSQNAPKGKQPKSKKPKCQQSQKTNLTRYSIHAFLRFNLAEYLASFIYSLFKLALQLGLVPALYAHIGYSGL